jgi:hypothetical protein
MEPPFFQEHTMWKLFVAFIVFAALAMYMLSQGGDIDMGGEKHGIDTPSHTTPASGTTAAAAATPGSAASK